MIGTAASGEARARLVAATPLDVALVAAERVLRAGGLVALPTETVYGLAASALSDVAVARLYRAKGRPAENPLIVHLADAAQAGELGRMTDAAAALGAAFWPGPLTIVLERRPGTGLAAAAFAGGPTIALRVPHAPLVRAIAGAVGPIVAPSANRSGQVSATTADAVMEELGGVIDLVVDGGASPIGVESTVVGLFDRPRLLRPGAICAEAIEAHVGPLERGSDGGDAGAQEAEAVGRSRTEPEPAQPLPSPGLLASHYAPRARVRLGVGASDVRPQEGWLALGPSSEPAPARTYWLSRTGDLDEAARNLYAGLRALDATGVETIAVSPIPPHGIGLALRDRLARAAAPRPPRPLRSRTGPP